AKTIQANDPQKNLALGYCIARKHNKVIKTTQDFSVGDNFDLQMQDGILNTTVNKIYGNR
ncbi:MAG: exodeoxyribonuclease VII large subunit, partial [Candidatus Pacebacteria bacterium]|nr:exodeoxyribonuclease VII large subunit [Candidatus Paceibacterota bacterium]